MKVKKITILFLLVFCASLFSNAQNYSAYEVKGAYLFHFTKYVTWPNYNLGREKFVIGLYGGDPFQGKLPLILKGRKFHNSLFKVVSLTDKQQLKDIDMVFISNTKKFELIKLIEELSDRNILIVGDNIKGFCEIGGHINFTASDDRYRVEVNRRAIEKAGLQISSRLLSIARIIEPETVKF